MTAAEVLARLKVDGVGVTLALDLEATAEPTPEALQLIRDNRDALLTYLAGELIGSNFQHAGTLPTSENTGVTLYGDLLLNLMVWVHRYHELRLEHPGGVILGARPEHAAHHLRHSTWCVLSDETKTMLATAGNVPRHALIEKTELQTTEPVQAALNVVRQTREKVTN